MIRRSHCWGVYLLVQEKVSQCKHESNDRGIVFDVFLKRKELAIKVGMYNMYGGKK